MTPVNLPEGLYLSDPIVSIDPSGGSPAPADMTYPWAGGSARRIRFAARRTITGHVTWLPAGSSAFSTATDPGFTGSLMDVDDDRVVSADVLATGMTATGSPSVAAYLEVLAAHSDGVYLTPATFAVDGCELVTGHPYFSTFYAPAGSTWLHVAVTLSDSPPTITDGNGFTWETVVQEPMGTGYLTMWRAKITRNCGTVGERVLVSQTIDSSIGIRLTGQTP